MLSVQFVICFITLPVLLPVISALFFKHKFFCISFALIVDVVLYWDNLRYYEVKHMTMIAIILQVIAIFILTSIFEYIETKVYLRARRTNRNLR